MRYFGRPTQDQCANLTYLQYYEQFSVEKEQRKSKRRRSLNDGDNNEDSPSSSVPYLRDRYGNYIYKKTSFNISRVQYMSPDQGDIWFLRLLLLKKNRL